MKPDAVITLLAYEARANHAADQRRENHMAEQLASIHARVLADVRRAVAVDLEAFVRADRQSAATGVACRNGSSPQGFIVSRTRDGVVSDQLAVDVLAGALSCRYETRSARRGAAAGERRMTIGIGRDGAVLSLWNAGVERTFQSASALSTFLLGPILRTA